MEEFKVNEYISLRLKGKETFIYIQGEKFIQCKYLLLNIPVEEVSSLDEINSIDEAADLLDNSLEPEPQIGLRRNDKIPPDTEFWGHCSNLQVWTEMDYDTKLLHRNIAFPLLKKLTDVGDPLAKKVFKEEIAKRIDSRFNPTITFLVEEGYLDYLSSDYLEDIVYKGYLKFIFEPLVEKINTIIENEDSTAVSYLIGYKYLKYLNSKVLVHLFENPKINFLDKIIFEMDDDPLGIGEWGYSFFDKIGDTISHAVREKLMNLIEEKDLKMFIKIIEASLLNNLKKKDLLFLIKNPKIDLLETILKTLRSTDIDSAFYYGQKIFSKKNIKYAKQSINEKILEIIKHNNLNELCQIIGLGLLTLLDDYDFELILRDPNIKILENYIKVFELQESYSAELSKYEIKAEYYPNEFFSQILKKFPILFKKKFNEILDTCNTTDLTTIIDYELLDLITKRELKHFLKLTKTNFLEKFENALKEIEKIENMKLEKYHWILNKT